jgi:hypothetical protein
VDSDAALPSTPRQAAASETKPSEAKPPEAKPSEAKPEPKPRESESDSRTASAAEPEEAEKPRARKRSRAAQHRAARRAREDLSHLPVVRADRLPPGYRIVRPQPYPMREFLWSRHY